MLTAKRFAGAAAGCWLIHMHDASATTPPAARVDFRRLVRNIQAGDKISADELGRLLNPGVRFVIARSLKAGQVDDLARDVIARVIRAIERNELRNPDQLLGYVRGMVQLRICAADMDHRRPPRRGPASSGMERALTGLSVREREILERFYVLGQDETRIVAEMSISAAQFRALKSTVKAQVARAKDNLYRE